MILETYEWIENHPNGKPWIVGKIGIVAQMWKHLYDYRTGFKGYEVIPVCRIGEWKKYYDNGQLAWTIDYGDGTHENRFHCKYPSYRPDGKKIPK